ncbi:MAG: hypothetical protein ABJA94_11920 [Rhodoglobus sp.]
MDEPSMMAAGRWGERPLIIVLTIACCGAGLFLAWHHPLWPVAMTVLFTVWVAVSARWPRLWLFALPAALPVLSFSPWTGWLIFDELDLLTLGSIGGGLARMAFSSTGDRHLASDPGVGRRRDSAVVVPAALFGLALLALLRGAADAGASFRWFDGYADASNSLRLSKSLIYVSALWPLLRIELQRSTPRAIHKLARGMQVGLAAVGLVLLWERAAYPGLLDFSARYRTTAAFWEMHVGGAALDVYLALATPFAAWALISARSRRGWTAAAVLALLTGHACLTTFSRGAYVGVLVPLVLLGAAWWMRRLDSEPRAATLAAWSVAFASGSGALLIVAFAARGFGGAAIALLALSAIIIASRWSVRSMPWRRAAAMTLSLALITEAVAVIGGGTFMRSRLDSSESDFGARLSHWRHGVGLLASPADWLLGIGAGRLPARYASQVPRGEFSGAMVLISPTPDTHAVRLSGPATIKTFAGLFSLTQRVSLHPGGPYKVSLQVRARMPADLALDVCEQHLLYARHCQGALVSIVPHGGRWQTISTTLEGPELDAGSWYAPRLGVFSASVRSTGVGVELAAIRVRTPDGTDVLNNGDFSAGLAHWFPLAESHFLPWHIDNLYLELLIEHGALGLVAFISLVCFAFRTLLKACNRHVHIAPILAASLLGTLLVGSVSSVLDVPRISFLFLLLLLVSLQFRERRDSVES